ncbi:MAG TPA: hypothetical protein VKQ07_00495, partial [Jatrophihabitantaceae bacterium]|nr:hypothetical protein [Jatrophihabitantaceae bacterium]
TTAYPAGSMGPKIDACREFVTATGNPCAIGTLGDVAELLDGTAGTQIVADADAHAQSISRSRG